MLTATLTLKAFAKSLHWKEMGTILQHGCEMKREHSNMKQTNLET